MMGDEKMDKKIYHLKCPICWETCKLTLEGKLSVSLTCASCGSPLQLIKEEEENTNES